MDGIEVVGSQPHAAATSPFLLSSPPLGHHHHATYMQTVQTVQLSFDACLPYNAASSSTSNSVSCGAGGGTPVNAICANSSTGCSKTVPTLSLSTCVPLHTQLQITPIDPLCHGRQNHHHRLDDHRQHHLHTDASSPSADAADDKRQRQVDDGDKGCIRNCRNDIHDSNDKDKPGDLNTPVTTSSDLPSFFGPSALVEPPPISGTPTLVNLLDERERENRHRDQLSFF